MIPIMFCSTVGGFRELKQIIFYILLYPYFYMFLEAAWRTLLINVWIDRGVAGFIFSGHILRP